MRAMSLVIEKNLWHKMLSIYKSYILGKNALGLIDQALISAGNFTVMVLLARQLHPHDFGVFTLIYTALLLANNIQTGLITQAHNVLAVTKKGREYNIYTTTTAVFQLAFILLAVLLGIIALSLSSIFSPGINALVLSTICALVAWQAQEFVRRILYTEDRLGGVLLNDFVSYGGQIVLLVLLWLTSSLTSVTALYSLAVTSAAASVLGALQIRHAICSEISSAIVREIWDYGKWVAAGRIGYWMSVQIYVYITAVLVGPFAAGVIKAVQVILGPLNVPLIFLDTILPIRFSRALDTQGIAGFKRQIKLSFAATSPLLIMYCSLVAVFSTEILRLVYGPKYEQYGLTLALFALYYFVTYIGRIISSGLRAIRETKSFFTIFVSSTLMALIPGILLVLSLKVNGAILAMNLGYSLVDLFWFRKLVNAMRSHTLIQA